MKKPGKSEVIHRLRASCGEMDSAAAARIRAQVQAAVVLPDVPPKRTARRTMIPAAWAACVLIFSIAAVSLTADRRSGNPFLFLITDLGDAETQRLYGRFQTLFWADHVYYSTLERVPDAALGQSLGTTVLYSLDSGQPDTVQASVASVRTIRDAVAVRIDGTADWVIYRAAEGDSGGLDGDTAVESRVESRVAGR